MSIIVAGKWEIKTPLGKADLFHVSKEFPAPAIDEDNETGG